MVEQGKPHPLYGIVDSLPPQRIRRNDRPHLPRTVPSVGPSMVRGRLKSPAPTPPYTKCSGGQEGPPAHVIRMEVDSAGYDVTSSPAVADGVAIRT